MKISCKIFSILLLIFCIVKSVKFVKQVNAADSSATCLDGSQSFLYLPQNLDKSATNLIIYFASTPTPIFCGDTSFSSSLENCITVQSEISSYWKDQMDISNGLLNDQKYASWGKAIIPNCDGSLYQGYTKNPTKYKGK